MKVAIVYDRVNKWGGAERVLLALHEIYPDAPLYTAVYNPNNAPWAKVFPQVITSFLQKFPLAKSHHEIYPFLMPLAFENFNFNEYDLVISVTSEAAKGIITKPKTRHVCYCLTPTRYLWQSYEDYFAPRLAGQEKRKTWTYFKNLLWRIITLPLIVYLRVWDQVASQRPDVYLAISNNVAQRISKYYRRKATVIYPPVSFGVMGAEPSFVQPAPSASVDYSQRDNIKSFSKGGVRGALEKGDARLLQKSNYFLVVSRLVPYKRLNIAVEAFNQLGLPLKIIGRGIEEGKLKKLAKSNRRDCPAHSGEQSLLPQSGIEFLGQNLTDEELLSYYQNCRAIIFPGEEDLGLVPIEAQACGKPVIAYQAGGVLETVIPGVTGEFFSPQTVEALIKVVKEFKEEKYRPEECRENAEKFNMQVFKKRFKNFVNNLSV